MKFDNLLRYAVRILEAYDGEIPLTGWLKNFFRENPQMGSRDRKQVSEMVFCYFRLGHALKNISAEDRILTGMFLSNHQKEPILEYLRPDWHVLTEKPLEEKSDIVHEKFPDFNLLEIFPWKDRLSAGIDHLTFCMSFLEKPRIFIRIRPGHEISLVNKIQHKNLEFRDADPGDLLPFRSLSFAGGTKLDEVIVLNRDAVVQDLSSQQTALILKPNGKREFEVWDCCAGSGGKSILLADLYPGIHITVSDVRDSILKNLSARFVEAGIKTDHLFQADLTDRNDLPRQSFNFITADLPCTGSGTWSRSPEALYYFKAESISTYSKRQGKILSNIITRLKPGGVLVYITCSVFDEENEKVSASLLETGTLRLEQQELINGCLQQADSMYVARFIKIR